MFGTTKKDDGYFTGLGEGKATAATTIRQVGNWRDDLRDVRCKM